MSDPRNEVEIQAIPPPPPPGPPLPTKAQEFKSSAVASNKHKSVVHNLKCLQSQEDNSEKSQEATQKDALNKHILSNRYIFFYIVYNI